MNALKEKLARQPLDSQPTLDMRDIARSGHVTRWHSVRTGRAQTLAEHHYMVAMITGKLAEQVFGKMMGADQRLLMLEYALQHDAAELLMGDLPSPLKRRVEQLCAADGQENPLDVIEEQIAPDIAALRVRINREPAFAALVKLADQMDAILFLGQEGIGRHAESVCEQLRLLFVRKVEQCEMEYPSFRWDAAPELLWTMEQAAANQIAFEFEYPRSRAAKEPEAVITPFSRVEGVRP